MGNFEFIAPKVELLDPREALIPVLPEDQKTLSESDILSAASREEAAAAWKKQHWGTPRDARLIERLMKLPRLNALATRPPRMKRDTPGTRQSENKKRWWAGQGFQPLTTGDAANREEGNKPWPIWWPNEHLFFSADASPQTFILDALECDAYAGRGKFLRRTVAPELCRPPLVIINKAFTKAFFSGQPIVFQDDFQTISANNEDENLLLFLAAYLNTDLAQYLLFHTSASIGIERDIVRLEEILSLPFPLPKDRPEFQRREAIIANCAKIMRELRAKVDGSVILDSEGLLREGRPQFTELVYDYFEICPWERHLIQDTVEVFRPSSTPGSLESEKLLTAQPSTLTHRKDYADTLVKTFRGWTRTKRHLWAQGSVAGKVGLGLVTFRMADQVTAYKEAPGDDRVAEVMDSLRKAVAQYPGGAFRCLRGFALFETDRVHILKPLSRRHWTRTAALNDADEILTRMMEDGGWRA